MKIKNSSFSQKRRNFLVTSAGVSGAFVLGVTVKPDVALAVNNYGPELTHWILIDPDETVTVRIARTELGQGTFTGLAQMVAEELECDWRNVKSEYADVNMHIHRDRIFKSMSTGGSRGIRDSQDYIRKAGAAARIPASMSKRAPGLEDESAAPPPQPLRYDYQYWYYCYYSYTYYCYCYDSYYSYYCTPNATRIA